MNNMIDIKLKDGQSGYDAVGEHIRRYWDYNITDTVVCSIGVSYDGLNYDLMKEVATPASWLSYDVEFLSDWWEGEEYIKLFGIKSVNELDISGGIYRDD